MSKKEDREQAEIEESRFKVSDRRKFNAEGDPVVTSREEVRPSSSQETPADSVESSTIETPHSGPARQTSGEQEIDFSGFLLSLATSAMAHLGELPDPTTGQKREDLKAAHQMIDIISMLKDKTKGNLETDEQRLIDDVLYELRMKYLKKTNAAKQ